MTGSTDGACRVYGFGSGPMSLTTSWSAHSGNVDSMAALSVGQFATVGSEGIIKTWTLKVRQGMPARLPLWSLLCRWLQCCGGTPSRCVV